MEQDDEKVRNDTLACCLSVD